MQINNKRFKRFKTGATDALNVRLNYGYAVVRALVARSLASVGVNLSLGLGHASAENPLKLVDDFIEPYRPLVDCHVARLASGWVDLPGIPWTLEKKRVLEVISATVFMGGQEWRLPAAIAQTAQSFVRILESGSEVLATPESFAAGD